MIEQVYTYTQTDAKCIEKLIFDENINYIHVVLVKGDAFPSHYSNAIVYMTVVRGTLSIKLEDQEVHQYPGGNVLKIPFNTLMEISNQNDESLEIIIVKAPIPI